MNIQRRISLILCIVYFGCAADKPVKTAPATGPQPVAQGDAGTTKTPTPSKGTGVTPLAKKPSGIADVGAVKEETNISEEFIRARVQSLNACERAEDCYPWPDDCVIGCGHTINKRHLGTVQELMDRYRRQHEKPGVITECSIRCAPQRGVDCVDGRCERAYRP